MFKLLVNEYNNVLFNGERYVVYMETGFSQL